jgi:hypothetical protein
MGAKRIIFGLNVRMRFLTVFIVLSFLSACAARPAADAQVPTFAKQPYEPFSQSAAIAIAQREWRLFGSPVDDDMPGNRLTVDVDKPERDPGLWQRVGEYWWLGMPNGVPEQRWTGKHDAQGNEFAAEDDGQYAWSAAFVSYVMRIAGAGEKFPYSATHADYINAAMRGDAGIALQARDPATYPVQPGDLICLGRLGARGLRFSDLPVDHFPGHCDLVVDEVPEMLTVIGGNVDDAVTMKHVPVTGDGYLTDPDETPIDSRYDWFVVLHVLYDSP